MQLALDTKGWSRWDFIKFYQNTWKVPVIPIAGDKKPMVPWSPYTERMPTEEELKSWFDLPCKAFKVPPWGLAIVLLKNIFSIDLDTDEVYTELKQMGAYPTGACIFKSARGYHVIMRSSACVPRTVKEHNKVLIAIKPMYDEFGIGGDNNHLSIVPDTPGRTWEALYEAPVDVNYEGWMNHLFGWMPHKGITKGRAGGGWQEPLTCPWHGLDGKPHHQSLYPNVLSGAFYCHGCSGDDGGQGRSGTFSQLIEQAKLVSMQLPQYIHDWVAEKIGANVTLPEDDLGKIISIRDEIEEEKMPPALIDGVGWRGNVGVIYGYAGVGKSTLIRNLAAILGTGGLVWGLEGWLVSEPLRVLCLDIENPVGETHLAIKAIMGIENEHCYNNVHVWETEGKLFDINRPKWLKALEDAIKDYGRDVTIIDNLSKFTGKNTIEDYEMKQLVNLTRSLAVKYNILIVLIHHEGHKRVNAEGEQIPGHPKGGSSLIEDANFVFYITQPTGKQDQRKITIEKIRSIRAGIRMGDEFLLQYDHKTYKMLPTTARLTMAMARWLVEKYTLQGAADKLNVAKTSMSNYTHGQREPRGEHRKRLETICKEEGYVPRLNDIVDA